MCAPVKSFVVVRRCNRRKIDDPGLNVLLQIPILNIIYQLFMLAVAAAASHIHIAPRYLCDLAFSNFLVVCGIAYLCMYTGFCSRPGGAISSIVGTSLFGGLNLPI